MTDFLSGLCILFSFLPCFVPAVYLARSRTYLIISNEECNSFFYRLFFLMPCISFAVFVSSMITETVLSIILPVPSEYEIWLLFPSSCLTAGLVILYYRKFVLLPDMPQEHRPDFTEHEFYLFIPPFCIHSDIHTVLSTWTSPYPESFFEGHKIIRLNTKHIRNRHFVFTDAGEIVIDETAADRLRKSGLTGFILIPVLDSVTGKLSGSYYQLLSVSVLPEWSEETDIRPYYAWDCIEYSGKICYIRSDIRYDLNRSNESVDPYVAVFFGYQHYWILSRKAVLFFIEEFGQAKKDFQAVRLVSEETTPA